MNSANTRQKRYTPSVIISHKSAVIFHTDAYPNDRDIHLVSLHHPNQDHLVQYNRNCSNRESSC